MHAAISVIGFLAAAAAQESLAKSLDGWEGNRRLWRVEKGAIVGALAEAQKENDFLCTKKSYGDFELKLSFKVTGDPGRNSGIQFRTRRLPNSHEVIGYQADIGPGYWGALYDESRRNKVLIGPPTEVADKLVKPDGWNSYVIRAEGDRITLALNGTVTAEWAETDPSVERSGIVCLQLHGRKPFTAVFKDIVLTPLGK